MNSWVYHLDQSIGHRLNQSRLHLACLDRVDRLCKPAARGMEDAHARAPWTAPRSRNTPTRLDRPRAPHVTRLFFIVAQSFYYIISHFTITNSTNFTRVNSIILSHILEIFCSVILLDLTIHFFLPY
jgi:hypothetical protein